MVFRCCAVFVLAISGWIGHPLLSQSSVRFAAVGDFNTGSNTNAVATLVAGWNPDFVITLGDNNYTANNTTTASWDNEVGQYYGQFIRYPAGSTSAYAPGSPTNRFFPSLGNHDWDAGIAGWNNYFELPSNERYFDFIRGPVHFFVVDSDAREPNGNTSGSVQGQWLQAALGASSARWKIVYFHHPPYTSASRGSNAALQWPFRAWGASVVLTGHEHHYERILHDGFAYIVNGAGGATLSGFSTPVSGSVVRYNASHGAMLVTADDDSLVFRFHAVTGGGTLIDSYIMTEPPPVLIDSTIVSSGSLWKYIDNNTSPPGTWTSAGFDDALWLSGQAKLGFGDPGNATTINGGPSGARYITTYFRHLFEVPDTAVFSGLRLDVVRDDGAIVYLNGSEVWRTNMPAGAVMHSTLASSAVGGADETAFFGTQIAPATLRKGTNILAVRVHQSSITSSDLGFDLRLTGTIPTNALSVRVGVKVVLEGPFNPVTGRMDNGLNMGGYLALRYPGAPIHPDAVDSIGIEIRNAASAAAASTRKFRPAWLLTDGSIRDFVDTTKQFVEFDTTAGSYYVVVSHENHLAIMSAVPLALDGSPPAVYNFSLSQSQAIGTEPMKLLGFGVYSLYAGDGNGSGIITSADANDVFGSLNSTGHQPYDANLSGIVTAADANIVFSNLNQATRVP